MENEPSETERRVALPLAISAGLIVVALVVRGFLGVILALGAGVPAGYAAWLGMQAKAQIKVVVGILLLLAAVSAAALILLIKVLGWLT